MSKNRFGTPQAFLSLPLFMLGAAAILAQPPQPGQTATAQQPGMQTGGAQNASQMNGSQIFPPGAVPGQMGTENFQGSVPYGTASATPMPLTLSDAIQRGLRYNLGLL
ncbi:MAG: hypothetical protein ACRD4O_09185, partial [Bryobacteraceae bacterium]